MQPVLQGPVTLAHDGPVAVVCLNRPEVHNAIDAAAMAALEEIVTALEGSAELRAVVVTGAGPRSFCAGGDLTYFETLGSRAEGLAMSRRMQSILGRLEGGRLPVIAAINGDAWGGGCEILTACHLRLAVASARFSFRQAAMGVTTGWGGGVRLLRQLARPHVLRFLLTAETIAAAEASRLGFVDQLVDASGDVLAEALRLARTIAANSRDSVQSFLDLARTLDHDGEAAAIEREAELFADLWMGEHFRSRVEAWRARRAAPVEPAGKEEADS